MHDALITCPTVNAIHVQHDLEFANEDLSPLNPFKKDSSEPKIVAFLHDNFPDYLCGSAGITQKHHWHILFMRKKILFLLLMIIQPIMKLFMLN